MDCTDMENISTSQESVEFLGEFSPQSQVDDFIYSNYGISTPNIPTPPNAGTAANNPRLQETEAVGQPYTLNVNGVVTTDKFSLSNESNSDPWVVRTGPEDTSDVTPSNANLTTLPVGTITTTIRQQAQSDIQIITDAFENSIRGESSNASDNIIRRPSTSSSEINANNLSRDNLTASSSSSLHNPLSIRSQDITRNRASETIVENNDAVSSSSNGNNGSRLPSSSIFSQQTPTTSGNKRRATSSRKPQDRGKRGKCVPLPSSTSSNVSRRTNSEDLNPETVESAVEEDPNAQIVSVHRICVETAKKKFGNKTRDYDELRIINQIVKTANDKIADSEEEDSRTKTEYERQITCTPELTEELHSLFSGQDFKVEVFVQNVFSNNKFLLQYGVRFRESHINCLVFYYRAGDIFALTTRHSWNAIQWCSDYEFPRKIAARLLNPKGKIKSTDKQLIGNVRTSTVCKKSSEEDNPLDIKNICTNFVAEFRKNCSIYKFPCFDIVETESNKGVKVEVGFCNIRILKKLGMTDFLLILSHFSLVAQGLSTYDAGGFVEKDSRAHRKYLTMVSTDLGQALDSELLRKIYNAFHNSGRAELGNYYLCHKHTEDYSLATNVFLCVGKDKVHTFPLHPTLNQIVDFMSSFPVKQFQNLMKASTFEEFKTKFANFKLGYTYKDKEKDPEKIINYIEGDIVYNGRPYWKAISKWCSLAGDYIGVVQRLFQDILKKHLLVGSYTGQLKKPWPSLKEIHQKKSRNNNYDPTRDYIDLYKTEENFYTSDFESSSFSDEDVDEGNNMPIKLFDMLGIGDNGEMLIYIIQDGFNAKIRDVSTQIQKSLININKANFVNPSSSQSSQTLLSCSEESSSQNEHPLYKFYELHCENNSFCQRFPDYDTFQEKFKEGTFIFAIADPPEEMRRTRGTILEHFQPTASTSTSNVSVISRSFTKEKDLPSKLTVVELEENIKSLRQFDREQLQLFLNLCHVPCYTAPLLESLISAAAGKIYDEFKYIKFVDQNGSVTSKLLLCTENQFHFKGLENHAQLQKSIFEIVKMYQSQYRNVLPKLELITIRNEIVNACYEFKICQIP